MLLSLEDFTKLQFCKINFRFSRKTVLWTVFLEPFPKITEFWKRFVYYCKNI